MAEQVVRNEKLKLVKFGTTDMMVSELCGGTMTWGSFNAEEPLAWEQMDALWDAGCNFFDTAEMYPVAFNYGKTTEAWMGNWLAKRMEEGKIERSKIFLATKVNMMGLGTYPCEGVCGEREGCHSYDEEIVMHACKSSIERMQCEYIDLYQIHFPSRDTPLFGAHFFAPKGEARPFPFNDEGGYEMFEKQVLSIKALFDAGLIKHWGVSNENAYGITMFCVTCDKLGVPRPVSCQNDFSLCDRMYENDTAEAAYRFGVVGLPYGTLAGGTLTGKYIEGSKWQQASDADRPLTECRHTKCPDFQPRYFFPTVRRAAERYASLAEKWGITPVELALCWARDRWFNAAIISGTCSLKQVEETVAAFKIDKLPEALLKEIDVIHEEFRSPCNFFADKPTCVEAPWLTQ